LVGIGAGDPDQLTVRAAEVLAGATWVLADDPSLDGAGGAALVAPGADLIIPAGPPASWPRGDGPAAPASLGAPPSGPGEGSGTTLGARELDVVRLYPGDGLEASVGDRAALDGLGRPYTLLAGLGAGAGAAASERSSAPLPLRGRTVVVTRAAEQAAGMVAALRRLGARVVPFPTIRVAGPADGGAALAEAMASVERYDWLVVTSANGARAVLGHLPDARRLLGVGLAAIGPATAAVLAAAHLPPDLVPTAYVAEALLEAFPARSPAAGRGRVLIARAAVARDVLPDGLARAGWRVDVVEAYKTVGAAGDRPALLDAVARADVVTFTSPSTVERFVEALGPRPTPATVACIGPVTAAAARAAGLEVAVQAQEFTVAGLLDALVRWAESQPG
jgi:uroporphyrinogen III methyltransferase/synthase